MIEPTPRPRNRIGVVALALSCVSFVLSLISVGLLGIVVSTADVDLLPVQSKPEPASASQVEAVAHVTLPTGTVFLAAAYSNGLETRLSARFRIPRHELDAFISSGNFTAGLTPGLRAVTAVHNVGGGNLWTPEATMSVSGLVEQQPMPDGTYRSLLLGIDAPETITVFLYASRG